MASLTALTTLMRHPRILVAPMLVGVLMVRKKDKVEEKNLKGNWNVFCIWMSLLVMCMLDYELRGSQPCTEQLCSFAC